MTSPLNHVTGPTALRALRVLIRDLTRARRYRLRHAGGHWHLCAHGNAVEITDPCTALRIQSLLNRARIRAGSRAMTPLWYWALRERAAHERWPRFCPEREARREAIAFEASLACRGTLHE